MPSAVEKLLSISSEAIVHQLPDFAEVQAVLGAWSSLGRELGEVLCIRNGFWVYESSLLVRPFKNQIAPLGLSEWNEGNLWKNLYAVDLDHVLFFAEDAFGSQYCLKDDTVCFFDPETGLFETLGNSLDVWARIVTEDFDYRTGYPLAHAWQTQNHPLGHGTRLLPKLPFVLGGKYELNNLYVNNDVDGMVFRASVANQIRDVPDGGHIVLEIVNREQN